MISKIKILNLQIPSGNQTNWVFTSVRICLCLCGQSFECEKSSKGLAILSWKFGFFSTHWYWDKIKKVHQNVTQVIWTSITISNDFVIKNLNHKRINECVLRYVVRLHWQGISFNVSSIEIERMCQTN
jgi:hypothetical protein